MELKPSPFAPEDFPEMTALDGFRVGVAATGVKYRGRNDVLVVTMDEGTTVAGVFTKSKCPSAPVDWCRKSLANGVARALVVNASNANAFTGIKGEQTVEAIAKAAAAKLGAEPSMVYQASTGVIGEPLDPAPITATFESLMDDAKQDASWLDAAKTIMTTDTFPKVATASVDIDGVEVRIYGMAKGSA